MAKPTPSPRARLLELLEPRGRCPLTECRSQPRRAALAELLAEGLVVQRGTQIFESRAALAQRLEAVLAATPKLFKRQTLKGGRVAHPAFDAALEDLWAARRVLRFEVQSDAKLEFLYLHARHIGRAPAAPVPAAASGALETDLLSAYRRLQARDGLAAVRLAALVAECGHPLAEVQAWIRRRVVAEGWGSLETGNWPDATAEERAAAIEHLGVPRLYVRLAPPPGS
ncbi:MAG: hypothetical protein JSR82_20230 [Verrucomicrobia bacterium]|nr:hypothetical protein [Verrucomicrobiota bacterium]